MSLRRNGQFLLTGAIGAILWLLLTFLIPGPQGVTGPGSITTNIVAILSGLLLLVGLPAIYRAQAKQIGILGLLSVVLLGIAIVLVLLVLSGVEILDVTIPGSIPHTGDGPPLLALIPAILGSVLLFVGGLIVGITTIRAHVFTAVIGWVILIGSVLMLLTLPVSNTLGVTGLILKNSAAALLFAGLAWAGAVCSSRVNSTHASKSVLQRN